MFKTWIFIGIASVLMTFFSCIAGLAGLGNQMKQKADAKKKVAQEAQKVKNEELANSKVIAFPLFVGVEDEIAPDVFFVVTKYETDGHYRYRSRSGQVFQTVNEVSQIKFEIRNKSKKPYDFQGFALLKLQDFEGRNYETRRIRGNYKGLDRGEILDEWRGTIQSGKTMYGMMPFEPLRDSVSYNLIYRIK